MIKKTIEKEENSRTNVQNSRKILRGGGSRHEKPCIRWQLKNPCAQNNITFWPYYFFVGMQIRKKIKQAELKKHITIEKGRKNCLYVNGKR